MIQVDEQIFQIGWFNHQAAYIECLGRDVFETSNSLHQKCQELPGRGDLEAMELQRSLKNSGKLT